MPEFFKRFHIPFVSTLILMGALLGPHGANYITSNETIEFFGFLGFTFLMFMAGLETKISDIRHEARHIAIIATLNGAIPFLTGLGIGLYFGYSMQTSLLLGTLFISSSVAIIVPTLKSLGLFDKKIGKAILSSVIVMDIVGLFAVAFMLQNITPVTSLPLIVYFAVLIASLFFLRAFLPRFAEFFIKRRWFGRKQPYEGELRFIIVVLIAVLIYFELLGVHPILAAFLVGLLLSEVPTHEIIFTKLHTIGYGLFIPVFFFIVGMKMDLSIFGHLSLDNIIPIAVIAGLLISKIGSGYAAARFAKLNHKNALALGTISTAKLATALAVAYAVAPLGIIDDSLLTAIIAIPIVTSILGPVALRAILIKD